MTSRIKRLFYYLSLFFLSASGTLLAQQDQQTASLLINNVRIFDGNKVITSVGAVRIDGSKISEVSKTQLTQLEGETIIDGKGRFLMLGLIATHVPFPKSNKQINRISPPPQ